MINNYCFTFFQRLQEIEQLENEKKLNVVKDDLFEKESSSGYDSETSQTESDLFTSEYF